MPITRNVLVLKLLVILVVSLIAGAIGAAWIAPDDAGRTATLGVIATVMWASATLAKYGVDALTERREYGPTSVVQGWADRDQYLRPGEEAEPPDRAHVLVLRKAAAFVVLAALSLAAAVTNVVTAEPARVAQGFLFALVFGNLAAADIVNYRRGHVVITSERLVFNHALSWRWRTQRSFIDRADVASVMVEESDSVLSGLANLFKRPYGSLLISGRESHPRVVVRMNYLRAPVVLAKRIEQWKGPTEDQLKKLVQEAFAIGDDRIVAFLDSLGEKTCRALLERIDPRQRRILLLNLPKSEQARLLGGLPTAPLDSEVRRPTRTLPTNGTQTPADPPAREDAGPSNYARQKANEALEAIRQRELEKKKRAWGAVSKSSSGALHPPARTTDTIVDQLAELIPDDQARLLEGLTEDVRHAVLLRLSRRHQAQVLVRMSGPSRRTFMDRVSDREQSRMNWHLEKALQEFKAEARSQSPEPPG